MKRLILLFLDRWCIHRITVPKFLNKKIGYGCFMASWAQYLAEKWDMEIE